MKILKNIEEIPQEKNPVVTIGTFDGLHLGHQQIFHHLKEKKERYKGTSFLITFEPHPQLILKFKNDPIYILTTLEEKIETLKDFDIDYILVLEFTQELSKMTGEDFIENILLQKIGMIDVVIGYDHAFGYKRSGNIETLHSYASKNDFKVNVIEPYLMNDKLIKSTIIRNLISDGQIDEANKFLGRPYQISGTIVKGRGRGKKLQFPTANLEAANQNKMIPGNGIYAAKIKFEGDELDSAVSIGIRPTFDENDRTIEAFIFDFDADIYGKDLTIQFIKKLREEEKFPSSKDLIKQMNIDVKNAKHVLSTI
jgi:riboflavin kinase / FMN adenylyltransferase